MGFYYYMLRSILGMKVDIEALNVMAGNYRRRIKAVEMSLVNNGWSINDLNDSREYVAMKEKLTSLKSVIDDINNSDGLIRQIKT